MTKTDIDNEIQQQILREIAIAADDDEFNLY